VIVLLGIFAAGPGTAAPSVGDTAPRSGNPAGAIVTVQGRRSCKAVSSCREAVIMWCSGYSRADADGDGIPCENICRSKSQVDAIKDEIGC
jgi:hypothetical protein